ncbi:MAG: shikimate kinase [Planctomycetota bacterium]
MRLILTGCRGAGKSTVGKLLRRKLGFPLFDTDKSVEQSAGKSISEIFAESGEKRFRTLESDIIKKLSGLKECVIALGGGAVLRKSNISNLKKQSKTLIIYLYAPAEILQARCEKERKSVSQRPLLTAFGGLTEMKEILKSREKIYKRVSNMTIDTSALNPSKAANRIIKFIPEFFAKSKTKLHR